MEPLEVQTIVNKDISTVWRAWTTPADICKWNFASPDWECPTATNDVREGGTFSARMQAKDGSGGFDFGGTYTAVEPNRRLAYKTGDGRTVSVDFVPSEGGILVRETFEPETENPLDMQRDGWQSILDNFKSYSENL